MGTMLPCSSRMMGGGRVRAQREDQRVLNAGLRRGLSARGLVFNDVNEAPFRARLSGVYQAWRQRIGSKAWSWLEAATPA